ncbi:integrase arm-type DNA-binding domain-containing protein [Bosea sp. (in: a-proteobacteria)]|uniref:tyrosine-type recombinase/integrase n=1 Tax=Bosea sp. (in: a-proteobacteria) TaxID=1871050 RepID=UPI001AD07360|nr:integrase arm-type DNA-binding domain-containing protein [Bosea sp. (in: a-proteobacteria)]MBN9438234.1 tyrosine-type recombinase/integrase [Bosea sp. (in: a-proteobacteria)]
MLFTDQSVAKLSIPEGKSELIVFDDREPGFGVRLRAGGKRVWIVQYRTAGQQRRVTIQPVSALSAAKARDRAKEIKASVTLGADPQGERLAEKERAKTTLLHIADNYLQHLERRVKVAAMKQASFDATERYLRNHWAKLHQQPAHSLSRREIADRLTAIATESGPIAANRARAALSSLYTWAMKEGLLETLQANPVSFTNKPADERHRDRVLSHAELRDIWHHSGDSDFGSILRLLMLTAQRRDEVANMARSELALDRALWSIPATRTKNSIMHEVPLARAALNIVQSVPEPVTREGEERRDLVFGAGKGGFSGWSRSKADLDRRIASARAKVAAESGVEPVEIPHWTLHDLRRTADTLMNEELGIQPHVTEAILNHVSSQESGKKGVAKVYNRSKYAAEKRAALEAWAAHVAAIVK